MEGEKKSWREIAGWFIGLAVCCIVIGQLVHRFVVLLFCRRSRRRTELLVILYWFV